MCSIFKRIIFTGPAAQPCGAFLVCLSGRLACTLIPPVISSGSRPRSKKQEGLLIPASRHPQYQHKKHPEKELHFRVIFSSLPVLISRNKF